MYNDLKNINDLKKLNQNEKNAFEDKKNNNYQFLLSNFNNTNV